MDLGASYNEKNHSYNYNRKQVLVQKALLKSTDVVLGLENRGYEGEGLSVGLSPYSLSKPTTGSEPVDTSKVKYIVGTHISAVFAYPMDDSFIELAKGQKPSKEYDIRISDLCSQKMKLNIGDKLPYFGSDSFIISGIYKAKDETSFQDHYQASYKNPSVFYEATLITRYSFRIETAFAIFPKETSRNPGFFNGRRIYPKTKKNESIYLSSIDWTINRSNDHTYGPILLDKDGNELNTFPLDASSGWLIFGYAFEGRLILFYIAFLTGRYYRNRRKYILLRYRGTKRQELTFDSLVSYSIVTVGSLLIGGLLSLIAIGIRNLYFCSRRRNPIRVVRFSVIWFSVQFLICALFLALLGFLFYFVLAKKDLTRQMNEVKEK